MKLRLFYLAQVKALSFLIILLPIFSYPATNEAIYPGGGDIALVNSETVTVLSTNLELAKIAFDAAGNCLASSPADAACNGGAVSVVVGTGTEVRFMIFIRNASSVTAADIRFQDLLDDVEFAYLPGSIKYDATQADTATVAAIYSAVDSGGTGLTDAFDGSSSPDEFAGIDTTASPDNLLVGGDGAAPNNDSLNIPANKAFALLFRAIKN